MVDVDAVGERALILARPVIERNRLASASLTNRQRSARAAVARSKANNFSPSRRFTQRIGPAPSSAYWANLAESTSPKSMTKRCRTPSGTNCAIWPEKAKIVPILASASLARDEIPQPRAVEQSERDRPALDQRAHAGCRLAAGPYLDMRLAKPPAERLAQGGKMRRIALVVGEAGEMDPAERREMLEQVPRADLVAPVGRERDPVGEEENVLHPSPRAICGPIRLASGSGSFFHKATCSRYLGSSGLTERGAAPSAVRTA